MICVNRFNAPVKATGVDDVGFTGPTYRFEMGVDIGGTGDAMHGLGNAPRGHDLQKHTLTGQGNEQDAHYAHPDAVLKGIGPRRIGADACGLRAPHF